MKRKDAIAAIRYAAYHNDVATAQRLYVEHRISYATYQEAWRAGKAAKSRGVRCGCAECKRPRVWAVVESDGYYLIRADETIGGPYTTPSDLREDADAEGWEIVNADEVEAWMRPDPEAGLIEG